MKANNNIRSITLNGKAMETYLDELGIEFNYWEDCTATELPFKVGDRVRVTEDCKGGYYFKDSIGTVASVNKVDCFVNLEGKIYGGGRWYVDNNKLEHI
tara:strand:- start:5421 stop:5717 length:297 start_codon:yes stop_codon:yes gene_type:complete